MRKLQQTGSFYELKEYRWSCSDVIIGLYWFVFQLEYRLYQSLLVFSVNIAFVKAERVVLTAFFGGSEESTPPEESTLHIYSRYAQTSLKMTEPRYSWRPTRRSGNKRIIRSANNDWTHSQKKTACWWTPTSTLAPSIFSIWNQLIGLREYFLKKSGYLSFLRSKVTL